MLPIIYIKMKNKVRVPLFFFLNRQLLTDDQDKEFLEWMNKGRSLFDRYSYSFVGYVDLGVSYHQGDGKISFLSRAKFTDNGSKEVTFDFWKEHIKDRKYTVGCSDENGLEVFTEKVERHELIAGFTSCSRVKEAFIDAGLEYPMMQGRMLMKRECAYHISSIGYRLNIKAGPTININGTDMPASMYKSALARKIIFKCQQTGAIAFAKFKIEALNEEGETLTCSMSHGEYTKSRLYDLYFTDNSAARANGYELCEVRNDWVKKDEAQKQPNAMYHQMMRKHGHQWKCDSQTTDFTIGFEIEKEDEDMKYKYPYQQLFDETGWIKESDSSLCDLGGYELVSPVFNLMDNSMDKEIANHRGLQDLINATYNTQVATEDEIEDGDWDGYPELEEGDNVPSCGGHINIGSKIYSPIQLFYGLKGFLPLLYSIYNVRVERTYSEAKKIDGYLNSRGSNDHHSALQIKKNVIELRIVSAVRNVRNLLWRRDLVRLMVKNINKSEQEVLRMMLNPRSLLYKHLRKVYKSDERYMKKCNDFVRFSEKYNDVKLPDINWDNFKS